MQMKGELELPPGFRFHPTDDELVNHYLCRKCAAQSIAVPVIKEIDLYKFDPWQLPEMGGGVSGAGEKEWYFFSPRDRKYPNGSRPNRAAGSGYWKATGADKPIGKPKAVGIKKALVFYAGKAPHGVKTNWIMHEYRLANVDRSSPKNKSNNNFNFNLRLDDWVLCRIYNKKGKIEKHNNNNNNTVNVNVNVDEEEVDHKLLPKPTSHQIQIQYQDYHNDNEMKPEIKINNKNNTQIDFRSSQLYPDSSDYSLPRLHTDSSCSEVSPDVNKEEVQSDPKWNQLELPTPTPPPPPPFDFQFSFMDNNNNNNNDLNMASDDDPFSLHFQINQSSPFQDILMFFQH